MPWNVVLFQVLTVPARLTGITAEDDLVREDQR